MAAKKYYPTAATNVFCRRKRISSSISKSKKNEWKKNSRILRNTPKRKRTWAKEEKVKKKKNRERGWSMQVRGECKDLDKRKKK